MAFTRQKNVTKADLANFCVPPDLPQSTLTAIYSCYPDMIKKIEAKCAGYSKGDGKSGNNSTGIWCCYFMYRRTLIDLNRMDCERFGSTNEAQ